MDAVLGSTKSEHSKSRGIQYGGWFGICLLLCSRACAMKNDQCICLFARNTACIREKSVLRFRMCCRETLSLLYQTRSGWLIWQNLRFLLERCIYIRYWWFSVQLDNRNESKAHLVNSMPDQALVTLRPGEYPIIHSDCGCHDCRPDWIRRVNTGGLIRSVSKKGCFPDNSACEGYGQGLAFGNSWRNSINISTGIMKTHQAIPRGYEACWV